MVVLFRFYRKLNWLSSVSLRVCMCGSMGGWFSVQVLSNRVKVFVFCFIFPHHSQARCSYVCHSVCLQFTFAYSRKCNYLKDEETTAAGIFTLHYRF